MEVLLEASARGALGSKSEKYWQSAAFPQQIDHIQYFIHIGNKTCAHLSPYTLCRFLLGLPPGVMSLCLPASSNSFSKALLNTFGSIGSETEAAVALSLRAPSSVAFLSDFLFSAWGGGVVLRGAVAT
jgi:hypothetical protein